MDVLGNEMNKVWLGNLPSPFVNSTPNAPHKKDKEDELQSFAGHA